MKVRPGVLLVGLIAVLLAVPALAGPGDGGGRGHRFADRGAMQPGPGMDRPMRRQDFRRDQANEMPMFGRMSPEERRQLRRDIRNAGDDIYRRPPPYPAYPPYEEPSR